MPENTADYIDLPDRQSHAEMQSLEQHALFQHITALVPGMMFIYAASTGRFLYVSPAATAVLGYTPEELLHLSEAEVVAFIHPDDMPGVAERFEKMRVSAVEEIFDLEYRVRSKVGAWIWLSSRERILQRDADGAPTQILGLATDITAHKQSEAKSGEAEERLRLLVENTKDYAMMFLDTDARITHWNIGAERILGWTEEEAIGQPADIIFTPEDCAALLPAKELAKAMREGRANDERWHIRKDGSRFFGFGEMIALYDEAGRLRGFVKLFRDLTERKNAEDALREIELRHQSMLEDLVQQRTQQLQETNEQLATSNKELEQFAFVTSHDLQEPLRKIQIFVSLLRNNVLELLDETNKGYLDKIIVASVRMRNLIQDLLQFSRLSYTQDAPEPVDLNRELQRVLETYELVIAEKDAQIKVESLPTIAGVAWQLYLLFANLIGNSLKFTKEGVAPVIHITSRLLSAEEAEKYQLNAALPHIEIQVADNGIGFDPIFREKIFLIFQRLHNPGAYEGTGIGLSICSKVVNTHRGKISVTSEPGKGTTFYVLLPVQREN